MSDRLSFVNKVIATKIMGLDLVPPWDYRMAKIGRSLIVVFKTHEKELKLIDGYTITKPDLDKIVQPSGTDSYADRAAWLACHYMMGKDPRIVSMVEEVRYEPPPYSTHMGLAWSVIDRIGNGGLMAFKTHGISPKMMYQSYVIANAKKFMAQDPSPAMAICKAAVKMLEAAP